LVIGGNTRNNVKVEGKKENLRVTKVALHNRKYVKAFGITDATAIKYLNMINPRLREEAEKLWSMAETWWLYMIECKGGEISKATRAAASLG
jgi:hypothetical protein